MIRIHCFQIQFYCFKVRFLANVEEEILPSSKMLHKGMEQVEDILNKADLLSEHLKQVQPVESDILTSEVDLYQILPRSELLRKDATEMENILRNVNPVADHFK